MINTQKGAFNVSRWALGSSKQGLCEVPKERTHALGCCCTLWGSGHRLLHARTLMGQVPVLFASAETWIASAEAVPRMPNSMPLPTPCTGCSTQNIQHPVLPFLPIPQHTCFPQVSSLLSLSHNFLLYFLHPKLQSKLGWLSANIYTCQRHKVVLWQVNRATKQSICSKLNKHVSRMSANNSTTKSIPPIQIEYLLCKPTGLMMKKVLITGIVIALH